MSKTIIRVCDSSFEPGPVPGCDVFWQVGSSATLGTTTSFEGHILALTSITMTTGATILDGSALARNGAVTLDSNRIINCVDSVPEPVATATVFVGAVLLSVISQGTRRPETTLAGPGGAS